MRLECKVPLQQAIRIIYLASPMKKVGSLHKQNPSIHLTNRNVLSSITFNITNQQSHYLNQSPYLQSFAYTDHITSKVLPIDSDSMPNHRNNFNQSYDYTNCFGLMKSTRKFHMNTLKEKNYRHVNLNNSTLNIEKEIDGHKQRSKKYIIRKQIQKQMFVKQKLELTKLLDNDRRFMYASADASLNLSPRDTYDGERLKKGNSDISAFQASSRKKIEETSQKVGDYQSKAYQNSNQNQVKKFFDKTGMSQKALQIIQQYDQFQKSQNNSKSGRCLNSKKKQQVLNMDELSTQLKKYIQRLDRQLKHQIRKDAEYLVTPNTFSLSMPQKIKSKHRKNKSQDKPVATKQVGSKLHRKAKILNLIQANSQQKSPCAQTTGRQKQNKMQRDFSSQLKQYQFRAGQENFPKDKFNSLGEKPGKHSKITMTEQRSLMQSIVEGNYFKVEIELSLNKNLLHTKQARTQNNLLHLCILNNQREIYEMVAVKCLQGNVDLFSQPNKYNKTPLQLAKVYKFLDDKSKKTRYTVGINQS